MDILGRHSLSISWTGKLKSSTGSCEHAYRGFSVKLIIVMITFGLDQVRRTNLHPDAKIGFLVCMNTAFVCCFEHPKLSRYNHLDNIMFDVIMTSLLDVIMFDNKTTKHVSYSSEETFVESITSNYIFEPLIYY